MSQKFELEIGTEIFLQDDQGAEIDDEAFPILAESLITPNIEFFVKGETQTEVELDPASPVSSIIYGEQFIKFKLFLVCSLNNLSYLFSCTS